jgi:AraC-like DNA-binding protein
MELQYCTKESSTSESFYVERKKLPLFGTNWHYHEEYELFLNLKGKGIRIVGDSMDYYEAPELIFMGGNLPHLFKNEENSENQSSDFIVIKFSESFCGESIFNIPEFHSLKKLLTNSKRGLIYSKKTLQLVKKDILEISESEGINRMLLFIKIFKTLSEANDSYFLSSEAFFLKAPNKGENRIKKVLDYITDNYIEDITLDDLSEVAFMTTNSFCRYFKSRTGKTVFQFIREFRINKACEMLINGNKGITDICFDSGFNSLSTFNRIFKSLKNISASEYKVKYMKLNA